MEGLADGQRRSERIARPDEVAHLQLEVHLLADPEQRRGGIRRFDLPMRAVNICPTHDNRTGPPMIGYWQMQPVRHQRVVLAPEYRADVRRVFPGRVEIRVLANK